MKRFEGSYLGSGERIDSATVMECGVCWWVYDPQHGDPVWQVPPGTAFHALPEHWRCPNCDAAREQFMVLRSGVESDKSRPAESAGERDLMTLQLKLEQAYQHADQAMRSLPVYNPRLQVEVIGLRRCEAGIIGVVATPWCMNLLLDAEAKHAPREGSTRELEFPSGTYSFVAGRLENVGPVETCSLFSPMDMFDDLKVVTEVGERVLTELFTAVAAAPTGLSRRQLLRPGAAA